jgi:hypothetical protein
MINFKDNNTDMAHLFFNNCSFIVIKILNNEKSNITSESIYVKTLLEIVRISIRYKTIYCDLLEYCLNDLWNQAIQSPQNIELLIEEGIIELYFLVLKVSPKTSDHFIFISSFYFSEIHRSKRYRGKSVPFIQSYLKCSSYKK